MWKSVILGAIYFLHHMLTVCSREVWLKHFYYLLCCAWRRNCAVEFKARGDHTVFNIRLLDLSEFSPPDPRYFFTCANKLVFALSSVIVHFAHSMDSGYNQSLKTHFVMCRVTEIQKNWYTRTFGYAALNLLRILVSRPLLFQLDYWETLLSILPLLDSFLAIFCDHEMNIYCKSESSLLKGLIPVIGAYPRIHISTKIWSSEIIEEGLRTCPDFCSSGKALSSSAAAALRGAAKVPASVPRVFQVLTFNCHTMTLFLQMRNWDPKMSLVQSPASLQEEEVDSECNCPPAPLSPL